MSLFFCRCSIEAFRDWDGAKSRGNREMTEDVHVGLG